MIGYDEIEKWKKDLKQIFIKVQYIKTKCKVSTSRWGTGIDMPIDLFRNSVSFFQRKKPSLQ